MTCRPHLPLACLMMLGGCAALGSSPDALPPIPEIAAPHASTTPLMTAAADDPAWSAGTEIDHLPLSVGRYRKGEAAVPTRVLLLWDADWLYVRFICRDDDLYAPHGSTRDAHHHEGDVVEVFLDPVGDARQWYEIQLSPAGGVLDQVTLMTDEPKSGPKGILDGPSHREMWAFPAYDMSDLRTAAAETGRGWIADIAIPAEAICRRMPGRQLEPMSMRANFIRYERQRHEDGSSTWLPMNWSPVVKGNPHRSPHRMGRLDLAPAAAGQ